MKCPVCDGTGQTGMAYVAYDPCDVCGSGLVDKEPECYFKSNADKCIVIFASVWRTCEVRKALKALNMPFKEFVGVYKGVTEDSFAILGQQDNSCIATAEKLEAIVHGQESILVLSPEDEAGDRKAELVYQATDEAQDIGLFVSSYIRDPEATGYTYDPVTKKFWYTTGE